MLALTRAMGRRDARPGFSPRFTGETGGVHV